VSSSNNDSSVVPTSTRVSNSPVSFSTVTVPRSEPNVAFV